MADPVVSYRYGKRPLIDVPALQVTSGTYQTITSLQKPVPYYRDPPPPPPIPPPPPHSAVPVTVYPRPYHTAPPPDPFHYNHYDPNETSRNYYYGPHGEVVKPIERYFDSRPQRYPGVVYPSPPPPPPPMPVHPLPPPNPHYHVHPPNYTSQPPQQFDINCELEYGRVVRISVRESTGHFRGLPEYLRRELMKSYGNYPSMEVKIKFDRGDFHIFANYNAARRRRPQYESKQRDRYRDDRRRGRDRYRDEEVEDEEDEEYDVGQDDDPSYDSHTDAIRPRPMGAPRGILRDKGWNSYR